MGMRFSILASGSTGNATVVETDEQLLLIDAGLSGKRVEALLKEKGVSASDLSAIFVTHEHTDHIKGIGALSRKYNLPIYANERTWREMERHVGEIEANNRCILATGETHQFGALKIESFGISHDAAEPVGYCLYHDGRKLSIATDLGYVSPKVKQCIYDSDVLVLEANHDIELLRVGKYPWNTKRRILSDLGHLSNEAAGTSIIEATTTRTKRVYLAHLSRDHNLIDLARLTVHRVLEERLHPGDHRAEIMDTYYDRATAWDRLD